MATLIKRKIKPKSNGATRLGRPKTPPEQQKKYEVKVRSTKRDQDKIVHLRKILNAKDNPAVMAYARDVLYEIIVSNRIPSIDAVLSGNTDAETTVLQPL